MNVGITQRVDYIQSYGENRDCLDQRWYEFFLRLNVFPIPLPTVKSPEIKKLLSRLNIDVVLFSGGNTIYSVDKKAQDASLLRDKFETELFKEILKRGIKIICVCRGMQLINLLMGGSLSKIENHIAVKHKITPVSEYYFFEKHVNSYHRWGIKKKDLSKKLEAIAIDEQGNIEAFTNKEKSILGIMWHPEREKPYKKNDIELVKNFLWK